VTAHVEEGAQLSLLVPHHHVGLPQQLACEVLPSLLHLLGPPHLLPAAVEDEGRLPFKDFGARIP